MIDEIYFLYEERVIRPSIREKFIEGIESIMIYLKLIDSDYEIYMNGEYCTLEIHDDTHMGVVLGFEFKNSGLKNTYVSHKGIVVNDGCEEDFLISLEILKGVLSCD